MNPLKNVVFVTGREIGGGGGGRNRRVKSVLNTFRFFFVYVVDDIPRERSLLGDWERKGIIILLI